MKCIEIENGTLVLGERDQPKPGAGEVLIRNHAAGINRPDLLQRAGHYPPPPGASDVLGLECAGEIVELGQAVSDWKVGDKVCALLTGGGYAEFTAAPSGQCLPVPNGYSWEQAAALPETFFTVWSNLIDRAHMKKGETLLIHGGSSGIGTVAIQIAKSLGVRVMITAGTDDKCKACVDLGADLAVNYTREDFVPAAQSFGGGINGGNNSGVDVILDMVGGDYMARNIAALAPEGRLVSIAFLNGAKAQIDILPIMVKRLTLTGSTLRARDVDFKAAIAKDLRVNIWPRLESGEIRPLIHQIFPLKEAQKALELMETGTHIGKIVLCV